MVWEQRNAVQIQQPQADHKVIQAFIDFQHCPICSQWNSDSTVLPVPYKTEIVECWCIFFENEMCNFSFHKGHCDSAIPCGRWDVYMNVNSVINFLLAVSDHCQWEQLYDRGCTVVIHWLDLFSLGQRRLWWNEKDNLERIAVMFSQGKCWCRELVGWGWRVKWN